jgi:heat shock protein HslJ
MTAMRFGVRSAILCGAIATACSRSPGSETKAARVDSSAATAPRVDSTTTVPAPARELRGTDWRLTAVGPEPVTPADTQHTPYIILRPDSKQVAGSGGCNRMFGVYELKGEALRFSGVGATKMACREGMDVEGAFLASLLRVARWRVIGQQLELSDSAGVVVARFEARPK